MNADLLNSIRREVADSLEKNGRFEALSEYDQENFIDDVINHLTHVELLNYIDIVNARHKDSK